MRYIALACCLFLLFVATAHAEWLEASSDHFLIYSDQNEKAVQGFAERLERFHSAMVYVYQKQQTKPSPSNRVTIFVVSSAARVQEVVGAKNRYLSGVYIPRAGASVAVIPRLKAASKQELSGETVLYHEYAHHFMTAALTERAYPRWFVEGFAEFFAGVQFEPSGAVRLGVPPQYRAMELFYAREVPIRRLLDFDGGVSDAKSGYDSFYGQSWLLFHYLQMAPERARQMSKYGELLGAGRPALEAAEGAFGDLDQLDKDMESYKRLRKLMVVVLDQSKVATGPLSLRKLSAGEAAAMPIVIESKVGVGPEEAQRLVPAARQVAARFPDDPAVLAALAEAEFDAGNDDAAIAAADRALAIDPRRVNAYIQKGYALSRKVRDGALSKEFSKEVRKQFVQANKVENDHPVPLVQFYLGYLAEGQQPTRNAIDGLEWALQLAPFDPSLRWLVAQQMISDERLKEAALTLAPLAYSPHPGENTERARQLLRDVEARLDSAQ